MKIAVTYLNGNVFGHFGHSEAFKIYDIESGQVKSAEVVAAPANGHGEEGHSCGEHHCGGHDCSHK